MWWLGWKLTKGRIERNQKADGGHKNLHRADKELSTKLAETDIPFLKFGVQCPVSGLMTQAACFVYKKLRRVAFVDNDYINEEYGALDDTREVLGPTPA